MWMIASALTSAAIDAARPFVGMPTVVSPCRDGGTKPLVDRPSEANATLLARSEGDRRDARLCGEGVLGTEAGWVFTELGHDLRGVHLSGPWKGHDDAAGGELGNSMLNGAGESLNARDKDT